MASGCGGVLISLGYGLRVALGFVFAVNISFLSLMLTPLDWSGRRYRWWLQNLFGRVLCRVGRVRVSVRGADHIPNQGVVVCTNHTHNFDIFIIQSALPRLLGWVAKSVLRWVPVVGLAIASYGSVFLRRDGSRQDRVQLDRVRKRLADSPMFSLVVFPEGTRSGTGILRSFKKGAFHVAKQSGAPILPATILGCELLAQRRRCWNVDWVDVDIVFHPVISSEFIASSSVEDLAQRTRQIIRAALPTHLKGSETA